MSIDVLCASPTTLVPYRRISFKLVDPAFHRQEHSSRLAQIRLEKTKAILFRHGNLPILFEDAFLVPKLALFAGLGAGALDLARPALFARVGCSLDALGSVHCVWMSS